jgi:hypothetical protein
MVSRLSARHWRLDESTCKALSAAERTERVAAADVFFTAAAAHHSQFRHEMREMLDEQMGLLLVAEPRRRASLEIEAEQHIVLRTKFFWVKFGGDRLHHCVLSHRRSAWHVWAVEAAVRRELECRLYLELTGIRELLELHEAMAAYHRKSVLTVAARITQLTRSQQRRLSELRAARSREALAVMHADFQLSHEAARARVEWGEELQRKELISAFCGYQE